MKFVLGLIYVVEEGKVVLRRGWKREDIGTVLTRKTNSRTLVDGSKVPSQTREDGSTEEVGKGDENLEPQVGLKIGSWTLWCNINNGLYG